MIRRGYSAHYRSLGTLISRLDKPHCAAPISHDIIQYNNQTQQGDIK